MLLRRLRGLIGVGLTWGTVWAVVMAAIGVVIGVFDPDSIDPGESPLIIGGIVGLLGAGSASASVAIARRAALLDSE